VVRGIALPLLLTLGLGEDGSLAAAWFTRQDLFEAEAGPSERFEALAEHVMELEWMLRARWVAVRPERGGGVEV
jgi:hypothetical protein